MTRPPSADPVPGVPPGLREPVGAALGNLRWRLAFGTLLLLSALLATRELDRGALELHEAYVVETASEMTARGEWVVPYFNAEPRLRKPPLSYWLTAIVGRATHEEGRLHPWHGRLVSAMAAVGLVGLVAWLGVTLYDRPTGLLAGTMAATTQGIFHYAHSARADLLYAFWFAVALAGLVRVWRAADADRDDGVGVVLVWTAFAAATLTKGPQLPAMLLVAHGVWAWREGGSARRAFARLRPVAGLALWAALAAPWWLAMELRLPAGLGGTELSGSLLRPGLPGADYLYRVPQLLAPWSLLLPAVAALAWRGPDGRTTRWLAAVAGIPVLMLSLGSQQRAFYVLPVMAPFLLGIAAGTRAVVSRSGVASGLDRWVRWAGPAFAGLVALAAVVGLTFPGRIPHPPHDAIARTAILLGVAIALGVILVGIALRGRVSLAPYGLAAVAFALFWILGGPVREWTKGLDHFAEMGATAARHRTEGGIWTFRVAPDPYVYSAGPPIRELESVDEVLDQVESAEEGIVVIGEERDLEALSPFCRVERVEPHPARGEHGRIVAHLERRPGGS